jgi:ATP-dependent exoDNAse (exonuclease V) beta subunit
MPTQWSPQQQEIFREFAHGTSQIVVVEARAGTGKTTTILGRGRAWREAIEDGVAKLGLNPDEVPEFKSDRK